MVFWVKIHEDRFRLHDRQAVERLRTDIETAVRAGGAFVMVEEKSRRTEVLITASSRVRIDDVSSIAVAAESWGETDRASELDFLDFELYGQD